MDALLRGLEDAVEGRGSLFLISGEPGIGKSRLADELSNRGRERGARVLWGRCWEAGGAPPYWPWVQSLRAYLRQADPGAVIREMGAGAADMARMLPELRQLDPGLLDPPTVDPESARFRLFDAAASFLRRAAEESPTLLVLDDLHAADTPSLLLLEFLAGEIADARLMVIGTYRDVDPSIGYPLVSTLAQLARRQATRRLPLGGLDEGEVAHLVEETTGVAPHGMAAAIHRETEGNPLFVGEVARLLLAEGRLGSSSPPGGMRMAVPESVREVIGRRVAGISEPCRQLLAIASVAGREFDLDLLERITGRPVPELMGVLDEAAVSRVIVEVPGGPGLLRFGHALVRDTLYEEVSPAQRMRLHARIAEGLAAHPASGSEARLAEIAHHLSAAGPAADPGLACEYARRAGHHAVAILAFEEGVRLYRMALHALERDGSEDPALRCELLLGLGDAQARAGDTPGARETFLRAARVAGDARVPEGLARAALGYGGRFVWDAARGDDRLLPLLEEALRVLGGGNDTLRARLLARIAGGPLRAKPARKRRDILSREAVEVARRLDDPATLAYALEGRFMAILGPDTPEERLGIATELLRVARDTGDRERIQAGHHYRFFALLELGLMAEARAEQEAQAVLARELHQPAQRWIVTAHWSMLALLEGRFREAERLIPEALELGRRAQAWNAAVSFGLQMFALRKDQGRLAEMQAELIRATAEYPTYPIWRCVLANLHAELGMEAEAKRAFDELARDGFSSLPRDEEWTVEMALLAEVCVFLADEERASVLSDLLLPFAGLNTVCLPEFGMGAMDRYLGILAATAGRLGDAIPHLEAAVSANDRMGARPWAARARMDLAGALLARGGPADRERARVLADEARGAADELGMAGVAGRLGAGDAATVGGSPPPSAVRGAGHLSVFRREGEYWSIAFEGDAVRLRDTKGLRYLAQLLRNAGREVHVLDLAAEGEAPAARRGGHELREAGLSARSGGEGEVVLDAQARAEYRRRLEDLQGELEEAETFADPERAARAREEMEFIARELVGATGLGGRDRRAPSAAERARQSVTKALKSAMGRIGEESPALGDHFAATVHTGTFCSYVPDPRVRASWSL